MPIADPVVEVPAEPIVPDPIDPVVGSGVIVPVEVPVDIDPLVLVPGIDVDIDPEVPVPVIALVEPDRLRELRPRVEPIVDLPLVPVDIDVPVEPEPIESEALVPVPIEPAPPVVWAVAAIGNIIAAAAIESAIRMIFLLVFSGS